MPATTDTSIVDFALCLSVSTSETKSVAPITATSTSYLEANLVTTECIGDLFYPF